jgi:hypothetical protein
MLACGILLLLYSWLLSSVVLVTVVANDRSTIVVASLMFIAYDDDLTFHPSIELSNTYHFSNDLEPWLFAIRLYKCRSQYCQ